MVGLSVLMLFAGAWLSLSLLSSRVSLYLMSDGESAVEPMFAKRRERLCIKTEEKGSNTETSRRVSYYIPLPNPTLTLSPPFLPRFSVSLSTLSQLKVLPGIRRITQWVVNGRHLIRSFPFETETKKSPIKTKPPRFDSRQGHTTLFPRISLCRQQPRYQLVHHLHRVLRYQ